MVVEANDSALGVGLCGLHRCLTALHLVAGSLGKEHRGIPSCRPHLAGAALSDVVQVPAMKEARVTRSNMDFTGAGSTVLGVMVPESMMDRL